MTARPEPIGAAPTELIRLREEIERLDRDLIRLVARRVELARRVGAVKRASGLPALDPAREAAIIRRVTEVARAEGAPEEDTRYVFWQLIAMSRRAQLEER